MSRLSVSVKGYFLDFDASPHPLEQYHHVFCGEHSIPSAHCPNCKKPLLRFFTLDVLDERLSLPTELESLPLYFCWTCNIAQEPFFYRLEESNSITILSYGKGGVETDFPYSDYPIFFPLGAVTLRSISEVEQQIFNQLNAGEDDETGKYNIPAHQYGGVPYLLQQNPEYEVRCISCSREMPFLASIGDQCLDARGFTENDYVQVLFHYCASCGIVGCLQQTD